METCKVAAENLLVTGSIWTLLASEYDSHQRKTESEWIPNNYNQLSGVSQFCVMCAGYYLLWRLKWNMNRAQQKAPVWIFLCQRLIEYLEPQSCQGMSSVTCHLTSHCMPWNPFKTRVLGHFFSKSLLFDITTVSRTKGDPLVDLYIHTDYFN